MKLSIVIPSYNEEGNIAPLFGQIREALSGIDFECIFVDDGSSDGTFEAIRRLAAEDERVHGISLSRNFGHQTALTAGLQQAKGDLVVMMDADGQHPPQVILQMLEEQKKGFEIVNTRRVDTAGAGAGKKLSSNLYYKLINLLSDVRIEPASSDFRLMTRKAVDAFLKFEEKERFTRGLVSWMGFKQSIIAYKAPERMSGKSKYTLGKMIRFAFVGITSFSSKPLKFSMYAGIFSLIFGFIYSVYIIIRYVQGNTITGWASMMMVILFLGGIQLLSLGIIGEYIAGIFNEAKRRPLYFIKDKC
jgi:dolichol-phosphate mannosyltransferase